jgi:hypothetical protein
MVLLAETSASGAHQVHACSGHGLVVCMTGLQDGVQGETIEAPETPGDTAMEEIARGDHNVHDAEPPKKFTVCTTHLSMPQRPQFHTCMA